jgi:hypothetical protein
MIYYSVQHILSCTYCKVLTAVLEQPVYSVTKLSFLKPI